MGLKALEAAMRPKCRCCGERFARKLPLPAPFDTIVMFCSIKCGAVIALQSTDKWCIRCQVWHDREEAAECDRRALEMIDKPADLSGMQVFDED